MKPETAAEFVQQLVISYEDAREAHLCAEAIVRKLADLYWDEDIDCFAAMCHRVIREARGLRLVG